MSLENKKEEVLPELQITPAEKEKTPIEVINAILPKLDDDWENDVGKPYIKPGSGPENPQ